MSYASQIERLPLSITDMTFKTGTWTNTIDVGQNFATKTAATEFSVIIMPFDIPRRGNFRGAKLTSLELFYRVAAANLTAVPVVTLYRRDTDAVVATATGQVAIVTIPTTNDGVVTASSNDRLLNVTVTNPDWDFETKNKAVYQLEVGFNCAATTVLRAYSATAIYEQLT
jgi:hypothetical protein